MAVLTLNRRAGQIRLKFRRTEKRHAPHFSCDSNIALRVSLLHLAGQLFMKFRAYPNRTRFGPAIRDIFCMNLFHLCRLVDRRTDQGELMAMGRAEVSGQSAPDMQPYPQFQWLGADMNPGYRPDGFLGRFQRIFTRASAGLSVDRRQYPERHETVSHELVYIAGVALDSVGLGIEEALYEVRRSRRGHIQYRAGETNNIGKPDNSFFHPGFGQVATAGTKPAAERILVGIGLEDTGVVLNLL